jgi:molybdenum cofactor synthesis domain-containing protein
VQTAILTVSTSLARGLGEDVSGPRLAALAERAGADVVAIEVVPDDRRLIELRLRQHVAADVAFVFTTGGTGFTPDDVTPEATRAVIQREAPGFAEAMRAEALRRTPLGILTRLGVLAGCVGRIGLILAYVAVVLAVLSVAGVIALFDPLFTSGRVFGTLALGIATFLAGVDARRNHTAPGWMGALLALGLAGIFLLPLWPLVYALQWVPETAGATFIALFGLGWMAVGYVLRSERGEPDRQPVRVR